ncbi:MAG: four helix bundle protein [Cytophagales bacterium]
MNIAEGSTGRTNPEFKRYLGIALGSAIEVVCCLHLAKRRKLLREDRFDYFYNFLTELIKGIQALRNSIS